MQRVGVWVGLKHYSTTAKKVFGIVWIEERGRIQRKSSADSLGGDVDRRLGVQPREERQKKRLHLRLIG